MRNQTRGFGLTAIIIVFAVVILGAGGAYFYVEQEKKAKTVTEAEPIVSENEEESVETEEVREDSSSKTAKESVAVAAKTHPKVEALVYIYEDASGIPNRFNITCKVGTERQVSMFYIYPGDGSEYRLSPVVGRDQVAQVHTYPSSSAISYNVKCVPVYDSTDSPFTHLSPYVGTAVAKISTVTVSSENPYPNLENHMKPSSEKVSFNFSFTPTSGTMPVYARTSCSVEVDKKIIGIEIHRDAYDDWNTDEDIFARSFAASYSTRDGAPKYLNDEGEIDFDPWKGKFPVFCSVQFEDGSFASSDPIYIDFK